MNKIKSNFSKIICGSKLTCCGKSSPSSSIRKVAGALAALFVLCVVDPAFAATTINSATLDGGTYNSASPYNVAVGQVINVCLTVNYSGSGNWKSNGAGFSTASPSWTIGVNCANNGGTPGAGGIFTQCFNTTVPASPTGTLNAYFGTFTNTACGGAGSVLIWANAIVVKPVSAITSTVVASPTSVAADGTATSTITVTLKDGAGNPVAGKTVTLAAGSGSSIISGASGISNASGVVTFTVKDSIAETVTYTATDTTDSVIITQTASVTFTPVVSSFNVVEPGANATTGKIFTKIAGKNFVLDIVALDALNAISSSFTGVVAVEVVDNTTGSGVCANMTTIAALSNQAFVAGDAGRHALSSPNTVANVWRNARVRIKYPASAPTVISCSGDNFAIRPNSISVSVTDTDWQTAGNTNVLGNTAASGGFVHKAGRPFTLQATALNLGSATTTNYAGTPTATLSACAGTACTAVFGTFSLGTGTAVSGEISSTTATYSEVGAFTLQLQDQSFADVDASDGSTADCAGRFVCSALVSAGRFVPDHFDTVVVSSGGVPMACASGLTCPALDSTVPAVSGMVYARQSFTTQVTARNAAGLTTFNYNATTGLSKTITLSAWDALGSTTTQDPGSGMLANPGVIAASFVNGVASTSAAYYSFTVTPTAPTAIYLRAVDGDSVSSLRVPPSSSVEGGVEVVNGRIKVSNAYGSELLPLTLTATAQYYNGTGWLTSTTDNLTNLTLAGTYNLIKDASISGTTTASKTPATGLTAGRLTINLTRPTGAATGIATISPVAPGYLPVIEGRATFGVYKGSNDVFIYQRESY